MITIEHRYSEDKSLKMKFLNGVHKYRLLNSTNLSREQQQLVKATVSKMGCNIMKDQLKKAFH